MGVMTGGTGCTGFGSTGGSSSPNGGTLTEMNSRSETNLLELSDIVHKEIAMAHPNERFACYWRLDGNRTWKQTLIRRGMWGSYSLWLGAKRILDIELLGVSEGLGVREDRSNWATFTIGNGKYITASVIAQLRAAGVKPTQIEYSR